jgi:hypothetical protein
MRPQDLVAFGCDPRLLPRAEGFLKPQEIPWMEQEVRNAYVKYGLQVKRVEHFKRVSHLLIQGYAAEGPAAAAAEAAAPVYAMVPCSDDEEEAEDGNPDEPDQEATLFDEVAETSALLAEFKEVWPRWQKLGKTIDYGVLANKPLPGEGKKWRELDAVEHLMDLNIIPLLETLAKSGQFGYLPKMAMALLGNNLASSFCERINSAGKLVMTDGRTLLSKQHLEMLVALRINKKFMYHMKKKYKKLGKELIKQFAVDTGITNE